MKQKQQTALRISVLNGILNAMLAVLKLTVGLACGYTALVSDGIHSVADVASSLTVMVGVKLSARSSDREHPYGHERMECVAAVVLSIIVGVTGIGIGLSGVRSAWRFDGTEFSSLGTVALITAVGSVLMKEVMFRYTRYAARQCVSDALMADAWHLRSDALSSLGGLVGVIGVQIGIPMLDPIATVIISIFIVKAAVTIFSDAMRKMTDHACDVALQSSVEACVMQVEQVKYIEQIKTRLFGNRVLCEITVSVYSDLSCKQAYDVARAVEQCVCDRFECIKTCAVHIQPI